MKPHVERASSEAATLRQRLFNVVGAATWQMEQLLGLLEIVIDTTVPTAAVECRITPRLFINPDFVRDHCRTDEALFMLVLHELHHVVLGHTRLFDRPTPAHNIAFDAVINAMLCAQFPHARYVTFFEETNGVDCWPGRLLRPPVGWPGPLVFASDATEAECRVLNLLYGPNPGSITYLELFHLLAGECAPGGIGQAVLLGNHESSGSTGAATDPLLQEVLARIVGSWPRPPIRLGGRDEGEAAHPWHLAPPAPPPSSLQGAVRALWRRAGVVTGRGTGPWQTRTMLRPRVMETVVIQPRDRRVPAWRALYGAWPVLYRSASPDRRPTRVPMPVAHVYLDVSGSMAGVLPALGGALAEPHREGRVKVFVFSTVVDEVAPRALHRAAVRNTLGTDINCVLRHLMDQSPERRPGRVVVLTDGFVGAPQADLLGPLQAAGVRFFAGLTDGGLRSDLARLDAEIHHLPTG